MASMTNKLKAAIRRAANALGYDIVGYDGRNARTRLARLLREQRISLILDVGANSGAFGWDMRELGYNGRIVSFEPMAPAFAQLQQTAAHDAAWQAVHAGLGDRDEQRILHVAANSQSSSLLPMLDAHEQAAPESRYQSDEMVTIRRLDGILDQYRQPGDRIFLKIDTQGFEKPVLDGAAASLACVPLLQLECSLVALYDGAVLVEEMIGHVRKLGYNPVDMTPTFHHGTSGHLMQADLLFIRSGAI